MKVYTWSPLKCKPRMLGRRLECRQLGYHVNGPGFPKHMHIGNTLQCVSSSGIISLEVKNIISKSNTGTIFFSRHLASSGHQEQNTRAGFRRLYGSVLSTDEIQIFSLKLSRINSSLKTNFLGWAYSSRAECLVSMYKTLALTSSTRDRKENHKTKLP